MAQLFPVDASAFADAPNPPAKVDTTPAGKLFPVDASAFEAPSAAKASKQSYLEGLTRAAISGATFGWSDELEAAVRSGLFGQDYKATVAQLRDDLDAFAKENPKAALAADLVGGLIVPGGVVGKAAVKAASLGGKVLRGAGAGALAGGISGAGHNENPDDLQGDVLKGAAIGGVVGGVVPAVTAAAAPVVESLAARVPGSIGRGVAERRAAREIGDAVATDAQVAGRSTADELQRFRDGAASASGIGERATLASEGGDNVRKLAAEASRDTAAGQRGLREARSDTKGAMPGAEFDQTYALGNIKSPAIEKLIAERPALKRAADAAAEDVANRGGVVPNGHFSREWLHAVDSNLAAEIRAADASRQPALRKAQEAFRAELNAVYPELAPLSREYAAGSRMLNSLPAEGAVRQADKAERAAGEAVGVAVEALRGNKAGMVRRALNWVGGGEEAKAEAVAKALFSRYGSNAGELTRVVDLIERAEPARRRAMLDAVLATGGGGTLVGQREVRR